MTAIRNIVRLSPALLVVVAALGAAGSLEARPISGETTVAPLGLRPVKPRDQKNMDASGDGQLGLTGSVLDEPLRVLVLDGENRPVPGVSVYFNFNSVPAKTKDHSFDRSVVVTDERGIAAVSVGLGSKKGKYVVSAALREAPGRPLNFSITAMKPTWLLFLAFALAGGLGLFLYGMEMMSNGMKRAAGDKMKAIIGALTGNRFFGLAVGCFVTAVVQSSSATTVILVSFVQAGLMSLSQSMGIILGADIGTTFTVQLIAFKVSDYSLLMIGAGFITMTAAPRESVRFAGEVLLGAGFIFFGMYVMSEAMYPLRSYKPFIAVLVRLEHPVIGILVGAVFTAIIQSSGAFAGILLALSMQGVMTLEQAVPPLLGANIGTCVTAVLASLKTNREAKRVAAAHTLFKVLGVLMVVGFIPDFLKLVRWISPDPSGVPHPEAMAGTVPRQLANAHTIFNVGLAFLFLPFTTYLARIVERIVPDAPLSEIEEKEFKVKYLDKQLLATPVLALHGAAQEIQRVAKKTEVMFLNAVEALFTGNSRTLVQVARNGEEVQYIHQRTVDYLKKLTTKSLGTHRSLTSIKFSMIINELAHVSQTITANFCPIVERKIESGDSFSTTGEAELKEMAELLQEHFEIAIQSFAGRDVRMADQAFEIDRKIATLDNVYRMNHINRLADGKESSLKTSGMHLDILENFRRISKYLRSISAQIQIAEAGQEPGRVTGGGSGA